MDGVLVEDDFNVGDRYTYHYRGAASSNISIRWSTDIEIRNVTSYAAASMFVNAAFCSDLRFIDCDVSVAAGRWRSTNGDGLHVKNSSLISIEGCSFRGLGDDAVNVSECDGFAVLENVFMDKRRHALRLDSDDNPGNPPNSTNGLIEANVAGSCGGSFLSHGGGDYATVTIARNLPSKNNLCREASGNKYARVLAFDNPVPLGGIQGADGIWNPGDGVVVTAGLVLPDRSWHVQAVDSERVLIINRDARDHNVWLYLATSSSSPVSGDDVILGAPVSQQNPDEQYWRIESAADQSVRVKHDASGLFLAVDSSAGGPMAGDNVVVAAFDSSDSNQLWSVELLED